jgi:hypothetical protein
LSDLADFRLTRLHVKLGRVVDCRDLALLGIDFEKLCDATDYTLPQALAAAAITCGAEAILVPSATCLGDNLIVFPDYVGEGSTLEEVDSVDPRLYDPSVQPTDAVE